MASRPWQTYVPTWKVHWDELLHPVGKAAPRRGLLNPLSPYVALAGSARLTFDLTRRDVAGRYRGALGGQLWAFLTPLLMLAIYSFVFGYIFKSRWTASETGDVNFSIVLFVGLIFANFFPSASTAHPALVVSNPNYVKKVVFPLEVLPWVAVGAALFHAAISLLVLLLAMLLTGTAIAPTAILLPLVFVAFVPMVAGFTWFLAAMGVFFRDLQQFVAVLSTALVFLAPIFYPRSLLPEEYRWLLMLNPLSAVVEAARDLVLWGQLPDWRMALGYTAVSLVVAWLGWATFHNHAQGFCRCPLTAKWRSARAMSTNATRCMRARRTGSGRCWPQACAARPGCHSSRSIPNSGRYGTYRWKWPAVNASP